MTITGVSECHVSILLGAYCFIVCISYRLGSLVKQGEIQAELQENCGTY